MKIVDTHSHLNDDKLFSQVEDVVKRARNNGVEAVFNNADSFESFERILELQKTFPGFCYAILGIHTEFADESDDYFDETYKFIKEHSSMVKAIGEIGLDYHFHKEPEYVQKQKRRFIEQIRLAKSLSLPIVIHSRDADKDTLDIIKEELPDKLDLHCYSGSYETLKEYLKLPIDVHIGIGGVCTFKNARVIKEVIQKAPLDIMLTETDAPYLAPVPFRGTLNEPAYIPYIIKVISELVAKDEEECASILYNNGVKFYGTK